MRGKLQPLVDGYSKWINELTVQSRALPKNQMIANRLVQKCQKAIRRIRKGIDLILEDEQVRLAFCFANKVIDLQSSWSRSKGLVWHPFQLAFILMTIESIAHPNSSDRKVCDLLWVPTGTGKTEAYLAIGAFTMALRRRRALCRHSGDRTGAGTSVISRYTLRLLTIQQFRRALGMITACEFLRVHGLRSGHPVGWRPSKCYLKDDFIWGSTRFGAGLWVGGGVTPNRIADTWGGNRLIPGALSILKGERGEGEPAQVLNCPACGSILSIPSTGLPPGTYNMYFVVHSNLSAGQLQNSVSVLVHGSKGPVADLQSIKVNNASLCSHSQEGYFTLTLEFSFSQKISSQDIDSLWMQVQKNVFNDRVELISVRASRPGYFIRKYVTARNTLKEMDFEIFCPNPDCPLNRDVLWSEGMPVDDWILNLARGRGISPRGIASICSLQCNAINLDSKNLQLPDEMVFRSTIECFRPVSSGNAILQADFTKRGKKHSIPADIFLSRQIPIPACTVDDQVFHRIPSLVISTVDKFARLPFDARSGNLFGNIDYFHPRLGFYRHGQPDHPPGGASGTQNIPLNIHVKSFDPPDLILQDELHLVEGPLGSLAGIYETAVDYLSGHRECAIKYVASTATIRGAEEQVQAIFSRCLLQFPPPGLSSDDRFFLRFRESHPLEDRQPGRLYMGISAPGKGPLTPIVRIWSRLLQIAWQYRNCQGIDAFLTLVGYFNAIRELSGVRALYRQDIPERIGRISVSTRPIPDDKIQELSSRTDSTDLPAILNSLKAPFPEAPDALFATSMFGTGVDIPRLGLMVVHGQPKTTVAQIQATGRVGRTQGALVVAFLRASRPRDLNHYEFFCGYYRQLHRFVEPITVMPFAPGTLDRASGPVAASILRNMRNPSVSWHMDDSAHEMRDAKGVLTEVRNIPEIFEHRAQGQPPVRKPPGNYTRNLVNSKLDQWQQVASRQGRNLKYVEYAPAGLPQHPVVFGDPSHQHAGLETVYENVSQSLRDIEETTGFQTGVRMTQHLRLSQFVITWGPGSILEGKYGPKIIPEPDIGLFSPSSVFRPEDFEVSDQRMSQGLLNGARIFRLPSNAELGVSQDRYIYGTKPFPSWSLCVQHSILYHGNQCPQCKVPGQKRAQAIRFIRACPDGHMDDVDWPYLVHGRRACSHTAWFYWHGGGGALSQVEIECPRCRRRVNLGWAYGQDWPCSGRFPEREPYNSPPHRPGCSHPSRMIQRQASNLRIPELRTLFTIPPRYTRLHRLLELMPVRSALAALGGNITSQAQIHQILQNLHSQNLVSSLTMDEILNHPWQEIRQATQDVLSPVSTQVSDLLLEEFHALINASLKGVPPVRGPAPTSTVVFEVIPGNVQKFPGPSGKNFRITPVSRLRTIITQVGFRRAVGNIAANMVDVSFPDRNNPNQRWYPGVEFIGEGIFIMLDENEGWHFPLAGNAARAWNGAYESPSEYYENVFRSSTHEELNPVFVWWHTFSHFLIRAMSIQAGYSSASIRERVYFEFDQAGRKRGGVILYATQPGSEGTLGGLIALVPYFDRILEAVFKMLETCSNDPLCIEHHFQPGQYNGAACYGCALISETSCEHRNLWLDRKILLDNMP